jgi:hypothetical protein
MNPAAGLMRLPVSNVPVAYRHRDKTETKWPLCAAQQSLCLLAVHYSFV